MNRISSYVIENALDILGSLFCTDPEFIEALESIDPHVIKRLQAESPGNWKAVIGRQLGAYSKDTGKIRKAGRHGNSQVWEKSNTNRDITVEKHVPRGQTSRPAIRTGHIENLEWMGTDEFGAIKQIYDEVFGEGQCYFRPTNECIIIVSLDPDCSCFVGLRSSRENEEHKLHIGSFLQSKKYYSDLKEKFNRFKKSVNRKSDEEILVIRTIRHALTNRLLLDESLPDLCFIHHEWRFPDGKKSDLLAVNTQTGRLTIIEFKDAIGKRIKAIQQLHHYKRMIETDFSNYHQFFSSQLRIMGYLYNNSSAVESKISSGSIDLVFACPGALGGVKYEYIS